MQSRNTPGRARTSYRNASRLGLAPSNRRGYKSTQQILTTATTGRVDRWKAENGDVLTRTGAGVVNIGGAQKEGGGGKL
jgi:hypothetical protein